MNNNLLSMQKFIIAEVAQLVEHFLGKEEVSGSSPDFSSTNLKSLE